VIGFEAGVPVSVDGQRLAVHQVVPKLDRLVGQFGFGRVDIVENRRVGIKSREIYECPGALALIMAHSDLEGLTLERDVAHEKARLEPRWAELVYDGLWYSPLKLALDAFMTETQRFVTGEVRLRCEAGGGPGPGTAGALGACPGWCGVVGRRSPLGLYDHDLATYEAADKFRHQDAEGFVRIFGLGTETWAARQHPFGASHQAGVTPGPSTGAGADE